MREITIGVQSSNPNPTLLLHCAVVFDIFHNSTKRDLTPLNPFLKDTLICYTCITNFISLGDFPRFHSKTGQSKGDELQGCWA